jgi:taurine dioxygenase
MKITNLTPAFGAKIEGVKLGQLTNDEFNTIQKTWFERRGLLAFPGQHISDDDLLVFSKRLGELDPPPNQENGRQSPAGYPDIYVVSNVLDPEGKPIGALGDGEAVWHTDMSYEKSPPLASMLTSHEIPTEGGDTWFTDMIGAFEDMPADLKRELLGRQVKHDGTYNSGGYLRAGVRADDNPVTAAGTLHPAVTLIPESGNAALYLGRRRMAYIAGLSREDSEALLDKVWTYPAAEHRIYKHKWSIGDLVLWDNRSTMHRRDPFPSNQRRLMHRTQIKGRAAPQAFAA